MNELMDEYGPSSGSDNSDSDSDDEVGGPDFNRQEQYDYENPIEAH